jgi:hypothetical protein
MICCPDVGLEAARIAPPDQFRTVRLERRSKCLSRDLFSRFSLLT